MICNRCYEVRSWRQKTRCAFPNGVFDADNSQCGTMNDLRGLIASARIPGAYWARDDDRNGSLGILPIPEHDDLPRGYIVMAWYKDRGRTGQALVVNEDDPPLPLTKRIAERTLRAYRDRRDATPEPTCDRTCAVCDAYPCERQEGSDDV